MPCYGRIVSRQLLRISDCNAMKIGYRAFQRTACVLLSLLLLLPAGHLSHAEETDTDRSETVYVTADVYGAPVSVLSSIYLVNPNGKDILKDRSSLTDVKNITSTETPKQTDGVWSFKADGKDVSYQGSADAKNLPIRMTVTYALDGKEMTAEEIAGKSGRVRVTVAYENLLKNTVTLAAEEGEEAKTAELYTPFTIVTMIALDDDFRRIDVENAKIMSEAGSTSIMGITFPGLAQNLETDATDMLAESFSFEAKVDSFSLESIMAIAVPDLLDADDLNSMEDMESFVDGMGELSDAGDELMDGAKSLHSGMKRYTNGLSAYLDGIRSMRSEVEKALSELEGADLSEAVAIAARAMALAETVENGIDSAQGSVSDAKSKLQSLSGLTEEQQAIVNAALGDLSDAESSLNSSENAIEELRGLLDDVETPDVSDAESQIEDLINGVDALADGADDLEDGAVSIRKGMWALYKGLREFNNEGLAKITEETEGLTTAANRKDAMLDLSENYTAFSAEDVASGSVKFVFTTESIYVPKVEAPAATAAPTAPSQGAIEAEKGEATVEDILDRLGDFFRQLIGSK